MTDTFYKDPQAMLDYTINWSDWLQPGEVISTANVVVSGVTPTLICDTFTHTNSTVTCWLSAGTSGIGYAVVCTIVTNQGRTDERTIYVIGQDK